MKLFGGFILFCIVIYLITQNVVFNPTISEPRGYYFIYPSLNYKVGDVVRICVETTSNVQILHQLRVPFTSSNCRNKSPYLLKKIVAVDASGAIDEAASKKVMDFSITRNVASMFMAIAILLIVFLSVAGAYKKRSGKAPKGLQSFMEPLILFVRDDIALPNIGVKYMRFMPLLLTIFFFILLNNLFGMVPFFPGGYNLTGNIAVTAVLSIIIFFVVNLNGNKHYWKHIFVPNPWWLFFIMIPVELVGIFTKPIALMIRLFANITAGHILILSLISLIFIFKTVWVSPVSVVFVVFMDTIELLVAFLQAYIFTLLGALFIGMAIEEHHTDHSEVL